MSDLTDVPMLLLEAGELKKKDLETFEELVRRNERKKILEWARKNLPYGSAFVALENTLRGDRHSSHLPNN